MNGIPRISSQRPVKPFARAFTLAEVMIATLIFAMSATSLTSLFLQNLRYSTWQLTNVHITNSIFSIADQIKNKGANQIYAAFLAADPANGTPITLDVTSVDPSDLTDGYKTINLNINKVETATTTGTTVVVNPTKEVNTTWNVITFKLGSLSTSPSFPVSCYITIRRNLSAAATTPAFDILELTMSYSWSMTKSGPKTFNQIQLTFPAPNCSFN